MLVSVSQSDLKAAIRQTYIDACKMGDPWCYVYVSPDGSVGRGVAHSPQHFGPPEEDTPPGPRPVIVYSHKTARPADPGDGVFEWEDASPDTAEFWADEQGTFWHREPIGRHRFPKRLTSDLVADLEWTDVLAEVEAVLTPAGYEIDWTS